MMLNQSFTYKELTFEEWRKLSDSLPHEELITARDRAGSLLKHTKLWLDEWISNKLILKHLGLEFIVMPDEAGQISFIDGWIPLGIVITARVRIEGMMYMYKHVRHAFYQDNYDKQLEYDAMDMVTKIILMEEE